MISTFPTLFSPGRIGPVELRNRLVMAPMGTNYATASGEVTDRLLDYYAERAAGGTGLHRTSTPRLWRSSGPSSGSEETPAFTVGADSTQTAERRRSETDFEIQIFPVRWDQLQ